MTQSGNFEDDIRKIALELQNSTKFKEIGEIFEIFARGRKDKLQKFEEKWNYEENFEENYRKWKENWEILGK